MLYKRSHSRVWQCRYKLYDNQWHRQTTGRTVLSDAMRVAGELYDEARFRERMGLAPTRKTYSQIAQLTVEEMRRDLAAGTGKKIYEDYCQVIERYLVPFFGERHLQTLKHKDIAEFEVWRNEKMGVRLSMSDWIRLGVYIQEQRDKNDCFGKFIQELGKTQVKIQKIPGINGYFNGYSYFTWTENDQAPIIAWAVGHNGQRIGWSSKQNNKKLFLTFGDGSDSDMGRIYPLANRWIN